MNVIVTDASFCLALVLPDETVDATDRLFRELMVNDTIAPAVWPAETVNTLVMSIRRGRLNEHELAACLSVIAHLGVAVEQPMEPGEMSELVRLALDRNLTIYDACYLELALRRNAMLATLDKQLLSAASALGVRLLETA